MDEQAKNEYKEMIDRWLKNAQDCYRITMQCLDKYLR